MPKSIANLVMEYFQNNPNKDLNLGPIVDWVSAEYLKEHPERKEPPRDVWRMVRSLQQEGKLILVSRGIFRYDPTHVINRHLEDFTSAQKAEIMKRDNYRCVICGRGPKDGISLAVDHIKPKDLGGTATIENGQTLCYQHNLQKKNYKQTETGKKMFIRLYELAKAAGDEKVVTFCRDVLETYEKHDINGHIEWKP